MESRTLNIDNGKSAILDQPYYKDWGDQGLKIVVEIKYLDCEDFNTSQKLLSLSFRKILFI